MTALVQTAAKASPMPYVAALALGLGIVMLGGFLQADALHDAAHDTRHAIGFPCH